MTLPESSWVRYTKLLSSINSTAARKYEAYLKTHETGSKAGRKAAIDYAAALVQKYGESAAAVSCEMYDGIAEAAGVLVPAAEPAAVATYGEVAKTVNGMMKQEQPAETIANAIGRLVKRTGADTTLQNAKRDGAEFAWIPHGDTCSFCLMLASNGWRKASKKTIKGEHAEHIHSGCDCEFAIRFDGKPDYAGYDPEKYRAMYDNAEGDTWQEKLNAMRREQYKVNGDKIRKQKRAAYERAKELLTGGIAAGKINPNASEETKRRKLTAEQAACKTKIPGGFSAFPKTDVLAARSKKIPAEPRKFDVALHGTPTGVSFGIDEGTNMSARELARIIVREPGYSECEVIRLLACSTGQDPGGGNYCFAEELANALGKPVEAPDDILFIRKNGSFYVGVTGNGKMRTFTVNERRRRK